MTPAYVKKYLYRCPVCGQPPIVSYFNGPMNSIWCMGPDDKFHSRVETGCYYSMLKASRQWKEIVREIKAKNQERVKEKKGGIQ